MHWRQLAPGPSQVCVSPSEPTCTDLVQSQGGRGAGLASCALLAHPDLVPGNSCSLETAPPWLVPLRKDLLSQRRGTLWHPRPDLWKLPCLVPGRDAEVLGDLPPEVLNTIASARALSTRRAYALKWNLFVKWCSSRREDPPKMFDQCRAFLFCSRAWSVGCLPPPSRFMLPLYPHTTTTSMVSRLVSTTWSSGSLGGQDGLNPLDPPSIPSWDLALVASSTPIAPFEPLQSADLRILSMKTLLLVALASIKRVGDLQAFSVDESCLEFGPGDGHVLLSPRPGYVPKVPTTPFRDQVVSLQALPLEGGRPSPGFTLSSSRLATIHRQKLKASGPQTSSLSVTEASRRERLSPKQRMAHWIVDAIALAYQAQGVPCPLRLRAHSTRGVASSWALARGASLTDICRAAGWATPNTFARFYSLRVEPVSSRVLTSGQRHGEVPA